VRGSSQRPTAVPAGDRIHRMQDAKAIIEHRLPRRSRRSSRYSGWLEPGAFGSYLPTPVPTVVDSFGSDQRVQLVLVADEGPEDIMKRRVGVALRAPSLSFQGVRYRGVVLVAGGAHSGIYR